MTIPGSDNKYYKLNAEAQGFYPLDREHGWVLSSRISASFADGFGGKRLPFYQYYSAGGIGSLRGFAYGAIGPNAIYRTRQCPDSYCLVSSDVIGGMQWSPPVPNSLSQHHLSQTKTKTQ